MQDEVYAPEEGQSAGVEKWLEVRTQRPRAFPTSGGGRSWQSLPSMSAHADPALPRGG